MDNNSRTKNSIRNMKTGVRVQMINKVMSFISRTVFIYYLNTEYLGVNGLFSNVLSVLSFAELGIGAAIIYNMYKPVAENDTEKIKGLMQLYKKAYNVIGIVVFVLGLSIIPFMDYLVKDVPNIKENIILIYLLFLIDTSSSYFFTYKKSIITAHQKQSVINDIDSAFYLLRSIIQMLFLMITREYLAYLIIQILGTFLANLTLSIIANRMYPYLKDKDTITLEKAETKSIVDSVKSLSIYQFGSVVMNGTDNILISVLLGVSTVGLCSNYTLLLNSVKMVISSGLNGITASVGNLNASASIEKKEAIYNQMTLGYYLLYSFCAIAFAVLAEPFIMLWIGKEYILGMGIAISLALTFFIEGLRMPGFMFRTTLGLFEKSRATPYIGAISNIVLSIILGNKYGLIGIFIATSIAQLLSYFWIDPYLIYKYDFQKKPIKFFLRAIMYFVLFFCELALCIFITSFINFGLVMNLVIDGAVVILVPNCLNYLVYYKSTEFKELQKKFIYPYTHRFNNR